MAVIDKSNMVKQLNSKIEFPKDRYLLLCTDEKLAPSQGGNPMITRNWELISPEVIEINGEQVSIGGTKFTEYLVVKNLTGDDKKTAAEKTAASQARLVANYEKLGYTDDIDDENPVLIAKGKYADWICGSDENVQCKAPTPEERAKGKKVGAPIKGPDGKDIKTYYPKAIELLGLAEKPSAL